MTSSPQANFSDKTNSDVISSSNEWGKMSAAISALPKKYRLPLEEVFQRLLDGLDARRFLLEHIHESLAQLRLDMKYALFDLEATRRERDAYRLQLDEWEERSTS